MIKKEKIPYEYLVRFAADGSVRGQHIKYIEKLFDDETGEVYAEKEGSALSVGDESAAVMLDTAIGQINAALAKAEEAQRSGKVAAESARDAALAEKQQAETAKQAAESQIAALQQRLVEAADLGDVIIGLVESGDQIPEEVIATAKGRINAAKSP